MSSGGNITKGFSFFYSPSYTLAAVGDEMPRGNISLNWNVHFYGKNVPNNSSANKGLGNKATALGTRIIILWLLITEFAAVVL